MMNQQEQEMVDLADYRVAEYRIKEAAAHYGISLRAIAIKSGISDTRLRDVANNRVPNVTVGFLETVAATIGCSLGEIITEESLRKVPVLPTRGSTPPIAT